MQKFSNGNGNVHKTKNKQLIFLPSICQYLNHFISTRDIEAFTVTLLWNV
jgi:hypothetical protein